jgi:hypothetical protein
VESWSGCSPLVKINRETKHVEVPLASYSDAGSIPAVSTKLLFIIYIWPNIDRFAGNNVTIFRNSHHLRRKLKLIFIKLN